MAGLFSRLKVWLQDEKLSYSDLNAEFNNIINNSDLAHMGGHSLDANTMKLVENPGLLGSESVGPNITASEEIERIRFVLARIIGGSKQWYETPTDDLATLSGFITQQASQGNRIVSGAVSAAGQPLYVLPSASGRTVVVKGTGTNLIYSVNGDLLSLTTDVTSPSISAPPASNNTATLVYDILGTTNAGTAPSSSISLSGVGSSITALVGKFFAFKVTSEAMLGYLRNGTEVENSVNYGWVNSSGAAIASIDHSSSETITLLRLAFVFLTSAQLVEICETNPTFSSTAPASPSINDMWFDITGSTWKKWNGSNWIVSNSILVGFAICDGSNCVAAKSLDFSLTYSDLCRNDLMYESTSTVSTWQKDVNVSVYGSTLNYPNTKFRWLNTGTTFEGAAITTNKTYGVYVSPKGTTYLSTLSPIDRRQDLGGFYHPNAPLRCLGVVRTDGSSNFTASTLNSAHRQKIILSGQESIEKNPVVLSASVGGTVGTTPSYTALFAVTCAPNRRPVLVTLGPQLTGSAIVKACDRSGTVNSVLVEKTIVTPTTTATSTLFARDVINPADILFHFVDDAIVLDQAAVVTYTVSLAGSAGVTVSGYRLTATVIGGGF